MRPTQYLTLGLALSAFPFSFANQVLHAVWSKSQFSTISGPDGQSSETNYDSGFSLIDGGTGKQLFTSEDVAICSNVDERIQTFEYGGFTPAYKFGCQAEFSGNPEYCAVYDEKGVLMEDSKGNSSMKFIGIAITSDGYCGVSFTLKDGETVTNPSFNFAIAL